MPLPEDRVLLERFRQGDRQAMEAVFRDHSEPLARYLRGGFAFDSGGRPLHYGGVCDRFDLHDLIAETFRRAFEPRARLAYDGIAPYDAYIRRIARNLVIDRFRADRRLQVNTEVADAAAASAAAAGQVAVEPSAARRYEQAELRQLLEGFTGPLSADQRRLIALRYDEGLSQEATALQLRRSRRWVRTQEKKLRKLLLLHLKKSGYLPRAARGVR